ncbi:MAG TPA: hypothetical protein VII01_12280, partial [Solirubrobacteraceae bacterium]
MTGSRRVVPAEGVEGTGIGSAVGSGVEAVPVVDVGAGGVGVVAVPVVTGAAEASPVAALGNCVVSVVTSVTCVAGSAGLAGGA